MRSHYVEGSFTRPDSGVTYGLGTYIGDMKLSGRRAWQSNGGPGKYHHAKEFPFTLMVPVPALGGSLTRVHLVGVFAMYATEDDEKAGTPGAMIILESQGQPVLRYVMHCGVQYVDAVEIAEVDRTQGDGGRLVTIGNAKVDSKVARVDHFSLDVPDGTDATHFKFLDLGTDSSFVVFDVFFEYENRASCPFHTKSRGITLDELGAIVRVGDRHKFHRALAQLQTATLDNPDLEEAKGSCLTFLAVVSAALLELGAPRETHLFLLRAARSLDRLTSADDVAQETERLARDITERLMATPANQTHSAIDRSLAWIDRNYAKKLSDAEVADSVGLSTSHFRHLFREATGQPFIKYLMAVRLEKAKQMFTELDLSINEVSSSVGFTNAAHFSRAFAKRFNCSPTTLRQQVRKAPQ
jgi:AraC-like DNA-binding protein